MEIKFNQKNEDIIISLAGSLDIYTATEFKNFVESKTKNAKKVIINMEDLNYIDSSGIGILIRTMKYIKELDIPFIVAQIPEQVNKIFKVAGLLNYFQIMETEDYKKKYS